METEDYPSELLSNQVSKITKYNLGRGKTSLCKLDQKDFTRLVISQLCHLKWAFTVCYHLVLPYVALIIIDRDIHLGLYCVCVRYLLTERYSRSVLLLEWLLWVFFPPLRFSTATAKSSNSIIFKFLVLIQQ